MSTVSISLALAIRVVLVLLFLPFSALDKVLDFRTAVAQAQEAVPNKAAATALILVGLFVEVFMSAGVVSGIADRACAFVLAGYCAVTALVEAVLASRRLLEFRRRQGPRAVLGFFEKLGFGRWLSSHRLRNKCVVDRAVSRPSDDSIPSLPTDAGARTAVSIQLHA
jgi:hypothetical protein